MNVFGLDIPPLLLDLIGGLCVLVSLYLSLIHI